MRPGRSKRVRMSACLSTWLLGQGARCKGTALGDWHPFQRQCRWYPLQVGSTVACPLHVVAPKSPRPIVKFGVSIESKDEET